MQNVLRQLQYLTYRLVHRHSGLILLLGIMASIVSIYAATSQLSFKTSRSDLVDSENPLQKTFAHYQKEFRPSESIVVLAESHHVEQLTSCLDDISYACQEHPTLFTDVLYKINMDFTQSIELFYASPEDLDKLHSQVVALRETLDRLGGHLHTENLLQQLYQGFDLKKLRKEGLLSKDWSGIHQMIAYLQGINRYLDTPDRDIPWQDLFPLFSWNTTDIPAPEKEHYYRVSPHRYLMLINPVPQDQSFDPFLKPIQELHAIITRTAQKYPKITLELTGEPILDHNEMQAGQTDGLKAAAVSLVLISIILIFGFRQWAQPFFVIVTLLMALTWSLFYATLSIGHLNILSVAFMSMLLGLGIDFGIHALGRYQEERSQGQTAEEAIRITLTQTGVGITEGALTTSIAFFCMAFSEFKGIAELGIISGGGILLGALAMLTIFPAMILCFTSFSKGQNKQSSQHSFSLLPRSMTAHRRVSMLVILIGLFLAAAGLRMIPHLSLDYNLLNLQDQNDPATITERKLAEENASSSMFAISLAKDLQQTAARTQQFQRLPAVSRVQSILDILPDTSPQQQDVIQHIVRMAKNSPLSTLGTKIPKTDAARTAKLLGNINRRLTLILGHSDKIPPEEFDTLQRLHHEAQSLATHVRKNPSQTHTRLKFFQTYVEKQLYDNLAFLRNHRTTAPTIADTPPPLRQRYVGQSGEYLMEIYPKNNIWQRSALEDFVHQLQIVDANITGTPILNLTFLTLIFQGFQQAGLIAFFLILILITIQFRSFTYACLAFMPLLFGISWCVGIIALFDISLNPANVIILPLVIGVGIDNGIHIIHRFREDPHTSIFHGSTARCVLISCLTTIAGFASLNIASHDGLASIGQLMSLSIGCILAASLTVLPAVLKCFGQTK